MTESNESPELAAEREDETVDVEIFDGEPDPDLEPQSWVEVQDKEDLHA